MREVGIKVDPPEGPELGIWWQVSRWRSVGELGCIRSSCIGAVPAASFDGDGNGNGGGTGDGDGDGDIS
jgi:hypothetical protein